MRSSKKSSKILGRWHITEMEGWGEEYLNMEVKAFIDFGTDGLGQFQFGLVNGDIDYHLTERNGEPAVEWSWEGSDEMDAACGRGWATLRKDVRLLGEIFIHRGDNSPFIAERI